jgi:hypothetical protein
MKLKDLVPEKYWPVADAAIEAMKNGNCLNVQYRGEDKYVEVHAVGVSNKGKPCMRVYQTIGGAVFSGEHTGWKILSLENIESWQQLPGIKSEGPRPGYEPGDKGMSHIIAEISHEPVPHEKAA